MGRLTIVMITVLAVGAGVPLRAAGAEVARDTDAALGALVRQAMASGLSPGLAVAVVRRDRIAWQAGFGDADRETHRKVTPETRFYIASTTKALTALAAAQLAAEGTLDLEASLRKSLAAGNFPAGVPAESVRVRDLLTHTHGIDPDGPISARVAFTGEYSEEQLLRALGSHRPAPQGRAFRYSNLGYDLAAIVMARGKPRGWKEVVERTVTTPLGMKATTAYRSRVPEGSLAQPYEIGTAGLERIRLAKEDANMGPAGGHFSTVGDLARLLLAEVDRGRVDGRQAIPAAVIAETQRLQASQDSEFAFFHRHGWGLGWDLGSYDGDTLVHRFGSFPGYRSHVSFMPGRRLGVVVLSNGGRSGSLLADIVAAGIYDRLRERPDADERLAIRLAEALERAGQARAGLEADRARRAARSQGLRRPLEAYAGAYSNPDWGTLMLRLEDGRLEATMGVARSPVEVYDAEQDMLRVELFGGGEVLAVVFSEGEARAGEIRFKEARFRRH